MVPSHHLIQWRLVVLTTKPQWNWNKLQQISYKKISISLSMLEILSPTDLNMWITKIYVEVGDMRVCSPVGIEYEQLRKKCCHIHTISMIILNINIWSIKAWQWLRWIYLWFLRTIKQVKCTPWRWFQFKFNLRLVVLSVRSKLSQYYFCWCICLVSPGYQQPWCWLSKLQEHFISGRKKLNNFSRYRDVIMSTKASPITGASIVFLTVCSHKDQRKH